MRTIFWTLAGCACTLVGLIGLILPIVPGILFLIFAAICFQRASLSDRPRQKPAGRRSAAWSRLDDYDRFAPKPALRAAEQVQLQFWLMAKRLLKPAGTRHRAAIRPTARRS